MTSTLLSVAPVAPGAAVSAAGHTTPLEWLWVVVPILLLAAATTWAWAAGDAGRTGGPLGVATRVGSSLRRASGVPAWCAGGAAVAMWALAVAFVGFVWDVAWHIDLGRDRDLFTVPHTLILTGLLGIGLASLTSIGFATLDGDAPGAWRFGPLRVPRAALALGVLSAGAAVGFPLDDIWHANYGVDVTMWSPTHLLMIGGASLAPIAVWLLLAEAGQGVGRTWFRHHLVRGAVGGVIVGLSTFQLEFDDGVPQWQALYQPVLIALATSVALVAARAAFGRGRALLLAVNFLVIRGAFALLVGPGLGHVVPRFPLYLGIALFIEVAFLVSERARFGTVRTALCAGLLAGTAGLATEWGFSHLWGRHPWQPDLLSGIWAATGVAFGGAVIGMAMGRVLSWRQAGMRWPVLAGAGLLVAVCMAVPLPRNTTPITATVRTQPAGAPVPAIDRNGVVSFERPYRVEVSVTPQDAAVGADWFEVIAWQGGGESNIPLLRTGPGTYSAAAPVPTGGGWKTMVLLGRRDVLMATPVSFPSDPEYGQAAIPPAAQRTLPMQAASHYLMREVHGGATWPAVLAYVGLLTVTLTWLGALVIAFVATARRWQGPGGGAPQRRGRPTREARGIATRPPVVAR